MGYKSKVKTDLTGKRFGLLEVVEQVDNVGITANDPHGHAAWLVRCKCAEKIVVRGNNIRTGNTKSCGCEDRRLTAERNAEQKTTHGLRHHWLYSTWINMNKRCLDPENNSFHRYGARGIGICDEWRNDDIGTDPAYQDGDRSGLARFIDWVESNLGPRPEGHTLDRIDNDRGYYPGNLRWADRTTQSNNQRPPKSERKAEQRFIFGY